METEREGGAKCVVVGKSRGEYCDRARRCSSGPHPLFSGTARRPDRAPEAPPRRLEWPRKGAERCSRPSKASIKIE